MRSGSAATWTCQAKRSVNVYVLVQSILYNHIIITFAVQIEANLRFMKYIKLYGQVNHKGNEGSIGSDLHVNAV